MTEPRAHPSQLVLDRYQAQLLEDPDGSVQAHISSCERCQIRLASMVTTDEAFLARYPDESALLARRDLKNQRGTRAEKDTSWWPRRPLALGFSLAGALAIAAAVLVIRANPDSPLKSDEPTERIKGGSSMELAIRRDGRSFPYQGERLRPGDVIAFRYTTRQQHLILLSLEATGKIQVFFPADAKKSGEIQPGAQIQLTQGFELDTYRGPERIIAIFSDSPLEVDAVTRIVRDRFSSLGSADRAQIKLGQLSLPGDQLSWLIQKDPS
jgi:hypothetical protein